MTTAIPPPGYQQPPQEYPQPSGWRPPQQPAPTKSHKLRWALVIGASFAAGALVASVASAGTSTTKTVAGPSVTTAVTETAQGPTTVATVTAAAPAPKTVTKTVAVTVAPAAVGGLLGDGTFLVGSDVQPGTYKAPASPGCYWVLKTQAGDIIDNGISDGPNVVNIPPTAYSITTQSCAAFTKVA